MPKLCNLYSPTAANIKLCANLLRGGDVVGVPTETVYGLAGNALSHDCAHKIFNVKGRPLIDPLIVHFADTAAAKIHIVNNDAIDKLAAVFWPGPLTMVVGKRASIPDLITAGLPSVAIRVPQHPVFRKLLQQVDFPLAAPSANPFGYVSPTLASHVQRTLGNKIKAILDGGPCNFGLESTIVDLRDPARPAILRHGPITQEQLSQALDQLVADHSFTAGENQAQSAPGQLSKHYSPNAQVQLLSAEEIKTTTPPDSHCAHIWLSKPCSQDITPHIYWLSESSALDEIAHNLFELIQRLDQQGYSTLKIEFAPNIGIGQAINDRLRRAAAK